MTPDAGMPDGLVPDSNDHEPGHDSYARVEPLDQQKISPDADVIVLFLPKSTRPLATVASMKDLTEALSSEHYAAWRMQSQNDFSQADLLQPAEDVWDHF